MSLRPSTIRESLKESQRNVLRNWPRVTGGAPPPVNPLLDGLVAWWSLDKTSGSRADAHTNNITLTDINTVGSAAGKINNAADFVFANEERLENTSSLLKFGDEDYAYSFWTAPDNTFGTNGMLFSNFNWPSPGGIRAYIIKASRKITVQVGDGTNLIAFESTDTLSFGTFSHVVVMHEAGAKELSIIIDNGTPKTHTYTGTLGTAINRFNLGANSDTDVSWVNHYDGQTDEFAVYNRLLDAQTISDLNNSGAGIGYPG